MPPWASQAFETALPLVLTLVHDGRLDLGEAVRCLTIEPARCYDLPGGTLQPGPASRRHDL